MPANTSARSKTAFDSPRGMSLRSWMHDSTQVGSSRPCVAGHGWSGRPGGTPYLRRRRFPRTAVNSSVPPLLSPLAAEVSRQLVRDSPDPLTLEELEADAVAVAATCWSTWSTPHGTLIPHVAAQRRQVETTLAGHTSLAATPAGRYEAQGLAWVALGRSLAGPPAPPHTPGNRASTRWGGLAGGIGSDPWPAVARRARSNRTGRERGHRTRSDADGQCRLGGQR